MKINWGTKLIFFTVLFMAFIVSMIVVISRQDVPLVEENYYEKGLHYQNQIDHNNSLKGLVDINVSHDSILFSNGSEREIRISRIEYYRPSDPAMDMHEEVKVVAPPGTTTFIRTPALTEGKWKLKLNWSWDSSGYSIEQEFDR